MVWRWNLDYVVDPRGNTTSYWYVKETNKYAANNTDSSAVSYDRGGYLSHIDCDTTEPWRHDASPRSQGDYLPPATAGSATAVVGP